MKKRILSLLAVLMLSVCVWAGAWTPETLPVPANTTDSTQVNYVSNPDGVLSQADVDQINRMFFVMERDKGVRGLVIAVEEIDPDDPYEFTLSVANKHGIGGSTNTGIVVMVATVSRAVSILTGDGMEKFITDAQCSHIRRNIMTPLLKEGKWGEGIIAASEKISAVVTGQEELNPEEDEDEEGDGDALMWMGLTIGGLVGGAAYARRKSRECPKCKKHNYALKLRQVALASDEEGALTEAENEVELQAKLLAMRIQKNQNMMDAVKAYQEGSMQESALSNVLSTCMAKSEHELNTMLMAVSPDMAAKAVQTAERKKAFDNEKKSVSRSSLRKPNGIYRNVQIVDIFCCPDCGYEVRKERKASASMFKLGLFTSAAASVYQSASSGGSGFSGSSRGGFSGGGRSHSWGSSGGGHFGGGGSSGRF